MRWLARARAAALARCLMGLSRSRSAPGRSGPASTWAPAYGSTRMLVGADGPRSAVARSLQLGVNRQFLAGIEHEYADAPIAGR